MDKATKRKKWPVMTDGERFTVLAGGIADAWVAYEDGADPARSLRAIWDVLQELIDERLENPK